MTHSCVYIYDWHISHTVISIVPILRFVSFVYCIVIIIGVILPYYHWSKTERSLHWRHNDHNSVSNHQPHGCLLNRLFRHRSKKTSKLCITGLCADNSPGPVNSPHKGPVTQKIIPFDDVIMCWWICLMNTRMKWPIVLTTTFDGITNRRNLSKVNIEFDRQQLLMSFWQKKLF